MAFWRKEQKKKESHDPRALIARREYDKAIKAYRSLLQTNPDNYLFNHKIADVYCLSGRERDALDDYSKAADGYARDGFLIKAIAILKKMQKIDPDHAGAAGRLEVLSQRGSSRSGGRAGLPPSPAATGGPEIALDMEPLDKTPAIPVSAPPEGAPARGEVVPETPLFSEMTPEELHDLLGRLRHHSFPAGAKILDEGEPGDSMFIIGQGRVRVTTAGPRGRRVDLAELGEGDFFGEVCLLTGKPRTATIISLEDLVLLELTREDLDEIEARHPRVRQVMKEFYERRVASTVEAMLQEVRASRTRSES